MSPAGEIDALDLDTAQDGVAFWIHVTPRARRPKLGGLHAGALRLAVREPPSEGAANRACVLQLAGALEVPRSAVSVDPASKRRRKRVRVAGDPERLAGLLRALAAADPTE
jgi:uncharacterized protein YggU (UPF0235/DUF167 family)